MDNLAFTITALREAYASGTRPADVIRECYWRIREADDPGIFLHLIGENEMIGMAQALGRFDPKKPLWGIPFAVKDNIDAKGIPTSAGCPAYTYQATEDAFAVAQLKAAGALLIGKTNLDQFATGLVGVRTPYPVPKNAIDPEVVPGGSSSGSAVAVAHGIVPFALGTDTAGSGRVPAALNNIVGLKPTLGTISATGVVPACRSLDTISIFALTVSDAHTVFRTCSIFDETDAYARPFDARPTGNLPPTFKVGIPSKKTRRFFGDDLQEASFDHDLSELEALGATLVEFDFTTFFEIAEMLYEGTWVAERYAVIETLLKDNPEAVHPTTAAVIKKAEAFSAADAFRDQYHFAGLRRAVEPLIGQVDFLCVPSIPTFYSTADLEADPVGPNSNLGLYTNFVNLLDLCALAVPTKERSDGRPGSLTLLAKAGCDHLLASAAIRLHPSGAAFMGATDWAVPAAQSAEVGPAEGEMAIAVGGAHMSGLPLNEELTRLGGRCLKATKTADNYRLYALAGGPPARPALVKSEDGTALEIEIWALPISEIGTFLSGIPAPLGLGTVALQDGSTVKGFISEPSGLQGARDITEFGGWRAFVATAQPSNKKDHQTTT
ncbi:MAG: allophanate hydrolase [Pseudomonadota bacterium]